MQFKGHTGLNSDLRNPLIVVSPPQQAGRNRNGTERVTGTDY